MSSPPSLCSLLRSAILPWPFRSPHDNNAHQRSDNATRFMKRKSTTMTASALWLPRPRGVDFLFFIFFSVFFRWWVLVDARAGRGACASDWVSQRCERCVWCVCVCVMCMQSVSAVGPRTQSIMMIENYGIRILLTALGRAHYRVCNVWMKRKRRKRGEKSTNNNNTHTFCIFLSMFASLRSCFLSVSVDELSIIIIIIIIDSLRTITAHQQATMPQPTQQQRTKTKLWNESSDFVWRTAERWQKNK